MQLPVFSDQLWLSVRLRYLRSLDRRAHESRVTANHADLIDHGGFELVRGDARAWASGGALGGFMSSYSKTPVGQAVIAGINQAVFELIKQVGAKPPEGSIVKADALQIYTNLGQDSVAVGDRLQVLRKGEELIDPETGISLGGSSTVIGEIEVNQVQEKFSIAAPVTMSGSPERGDKVVGTKIAAPLEFASKWKKPK